MVTQQVRGDIQLHVLYLQPEKLRAGGGVLALVYAEERLSTLAQESGLTCLTHQINIGQLTNRDRIILVHFVIFRSGI